MGNLLFITHINLLYMEKSNLNLVVLDKDELTKTIKEAVSEAINSADKPISWSDSLVDYLSLEKTMELLGRKKTWFHNKRISGELPAKKSANQWWYKKSIINEYIENGQESNR